MISTPNIASSHSELGRSGRVGIPVNVLRFGAKVHPTRKPSARTYFDAMGFVKAYSALVCGSRTKARKTHLGPKQHREPSKAPHEHHRENAAPACIMSGYGGGARNKKRNFGKMRISSKNGMKEKKGVRRGEREWTAERGKVRTE